MQNFSRFLFTTLIILGFSTTAQARDLDMKDLQDRADDASLTFQEIMEIDKTTIPESLLEKATCIAVFPEVLRIGFFGAFETGNGLVSCKSNGLWRTPIYTEIDGLSLGFQFGIKKTDLILVFVNGDAAKQVSKSNLTLGGNLSIAAGPVGRDLRIGSDYKLDSEIFSYSRSKGVFAGASLDGSRVRPQAKANRLLYKTNSESELYEILKRTDYQTSVTSSYSNTLNRY